MNSVGTNQVVDGSLLAMDLKAGVIPSQGALAYAHVNEDGTIDAANSKNVAVIPANEEKGYTFYCLDVTTKQAPKNVVATLDGWAGAGRTTTASVRPDFVTGRCKGKADAVVVMSIEGNFQTNHAFYAVFN
ncbi:MAG TPA: hypothetical protein VFA66_01285 [Gaiellaceae bacterium]|nr:hypothetical protein [Gaiellaceae bacterium]